MTRQLTCLLLLALTSPAAAAEGFREIRRTVEDRDAQTFRTIVLAHDGSVDLRRGKLTYTTGAARLSGFASESELAELDRAFARARRSGKPVELARGTTLEVSGAAGRVVVRDPKLLRTIERTLDRIERRLVSSPQTEVFRELELHLFRFDRHDERADEVAEITIDPTGRARVVPARHRAAPVLAELTQEERAALLRALTAARVPELPRRTGPQETRGTWFTVRVQWPRPERRRHRPSRYDLRRRPPSRSWHTVTGIVGRTHPNARRIDPLVAELTAIGERILRTHYGLEPQPAPPPELDGPITLPPPAAPELPGPPRRGMTGALDGA